ncbi:hypothetical protein OG870_13720 [Streptomyces sp. NBC_00461]|uniref:hypothetical protein n=1 Tax=Streptomyces sp. NBC_00461 TaxID=2975750 RepID=UPI002E181898
MASDAETILANNPDVNGLYGVHSYDGPALAQAVTSAGKSGSVHIVSDDSDAQTLKFIKSGVIFGTVVQCRTSRATPGRTPWPRRRRWARTRRWHSSMRTAPGSPR